MFIPPKELASQVASASKAASKVQLKSAHLLIDREVVELIFGKDQNVYMAYYESRRTLMIAPISDDLFKQLHKATQHMLKDKNAKGDKTIALHDLLIDHEINSTDRALTYECQPELKILSVNL